MNTDLAKMQREKSFQMVSVALNTIACVFFIIGIIVLYNGTLKPAYELYKMNHSVIVDAEVIAVTQKTKRSHGQRQRRYQIAQLEYVFEDKSYSFERTVNLSKKMLTSLSPVKMGEIIKIYINPANPEEPLEYFSPYWLISGIIGFLIAFIPGMITLRMKQSLINKYRKIEEEGPPNNETLQDYSDNDDESSHY